MENAARIAPVLEVKNLVVEFEKKVGGRGIFSKTRTEKFRAVDDISFSVPRGKTVGLVGESGCGKSTTARAVMRLQAVSSGEILCDGEDFTRFGSAMPLPLRRKIQMVFQNPYASLNPRQTISGILSEPLEIHFPEMNARERAERVAELLELVGLSPDFSLRFPHEFSGGQRQRIAIARALATQAELIVCDEPVSALDVSVQAQIVNLLREIQAKTGVAYLFVAHDLAVVQEISDEILVMRRGQIAERGAPGEVFSRPRHDYTRALLDAVPRIETARRTARAETA